jgi:hypothetical protein
MVGEVDVLLELLRVLDTGGLHSMDEVARRLGVSETLVAEMAEGLARRGYLAPLDNCGPGCDGCGMASICGLDGHPRQRTLMLTDKGRRAAV